MTVVFLVWSGPLGEFAAELSEFSLFRQSASRKSIPLPFPNELSTQKNYKNTPLELQNESFPNFSNFPPEFCPEFCSEFFPNFSRTFRASFRGRRRPEKNSLKIPAIFQCKSLSGPCVRNGPNTVSGSTVSNTELSEFFEAHWVPESELSAFLSAYYLCAKANSPSFSQNSPSLPRWAQWVLSRPKQCSRNSILPVSYCGTESQKTVNGNRALVVVL